MKPTYLSIHDNDRWADSDLILESVGQAVPDLMRATVFNDIRFPLFRMRMSAFVAIEVKLQEYRL